MRIDPKIEVVEIEPYGETLEIHAEIRVEWDGWRPLYEKLRGSEEEFREAEAELIRQLILKAGES